MDLRHYKHLLCSNLLFWVFLPYLSVYHHRSSLIRSVLALINKDISEDNNHNGHYSNNKTVLVRILLN